MKQRMFLFILCGLLVLLIVWCVFSKQSSSAQRDLANRSPVPAPNREELEKPSGVNTTAGATMQDPREQLQRIAQTRGIPLDVLTQQAKIQLSNLQNAMSNAVNVRIDFYGEVRDENEQPIEGANIYLSCVVFPDAHGRTNLTTDARGAFGVNSLTGAILMVQVKKDGYKENGTNQSSFTYYSPLPDAGFSADKSKPVIFHMEKLQ